MHSYVVVLVVVLKTIKLVHSFVSVRFVHITVANPSDTLLCAACMLTATVEQPRVRYPIYLT